MLALDALTESHFVPAKCIGREFKVCGAIFFFFIIFNNLVKLELLEAPVLISM